MICCSTVGAQISTYQRHLKDSSASILYSGGTNRLSILGLRSGDQVRMGEQIHTPNVAGEYQIYESRRASDTLRVLRNGKVIFSRVFEVRILDDIKVILGAVKDSTATINQILTYPKLVIYFGQDTFYRDKCLQLRSYEATMISRSFESDALESNGPWLSDAQKQTIATLKKGDKILFDRIILGCPNCTDRILAPYTVTITY